MYSVYIIKLFITYNRGDTAQLTRHINKIIKIHFDVDIYENT